MMSNFTMDRERWWLSFVIGILHLPLGYFIDFDDVYLDDCQINGGGPTNSFEFSYRPWGTVSSFSTAHDYAWTPRVIRVGPVRLGYMIVRNSDDAPAR